MYYHFCFIFESFFIVWHSNTEEMIALKTFKRGDFYYVKLWQVIEKRAKEWADFTRVLKCIYNKFRAN